MGAWLSLLFLIPVLSSAVTVASWGDVTVSAIFFFQNTVLIKLLDSRGIIWSVNKTSYSRYRPPYRSHKTQTVFLLFAEGYVRFVEPQTGWTFKNLLPIVSSIQVQVHIVTCLTSYWTSIKFMRGRTQTNKKSLNRKVLLSNPLYSYVLFIKFSRIRRYDVEYYTGNDPLIQSKGGRGYAINEYQLWPSIPCKGK